MQGIQLDSLTDEEFIRLMRTQPTAELAQALNRLERALDKREGSWKTIAVFVSDPDPKQLDLF